MGEASKRWSVTYTKQVKKKRAVYQDGFIELQSSLRKIMLYDEYDQLLESRLVKKEDVIKSGETLGFDSYLVDIGEECGDHKPVSMLDFQQKDKKVARRTGSLYKQEYHNNSVSVDRKPTFEKKKAPAVNLSPSQKIIKDFRKNEMNKYGYSPSCQGMTKSSTIEWQVLYTTQITQKAKKFHDGFLQLVSRGGSLGKKKLLDSRFVKKEDIIKSGETLKFDSYLVDIGDASSSLDCREKDETVTGRPGSLKPTFGKNLAPVTLSPSEKVIRDFKRSEQDKRDSSASSLDITKSSTKWQVLYTAQITQKAKKFHDGVLLLVVRGGAQGRQVTLLAEDGSELSHRYLKLSEDVKTGSTLDLPKYLVEVGQCQDDASTSIDVKVKTFCIDDIPSNTRVCTTMPFCNGKTKIGTFTRKLTSQDSSSKKDGAGSSWGTAANEPRRSALDILSVLRKPMILENVVKPLVDVDFQSSDSHSDLQCHTIAYTQNSCGSAVAKLKEETKAHDICNKFSETEVVEVTEDGRESQIMSSMRIPRPGATNSMKPVFYTECTNNSSEAQEVVAPVLDSDGQTLVASMLPPISNVIVKLENTPEMGSLPEIKMETVAALSIDLVSSKVPELCEDNAGCSSRCWEEASGVGWVASSDSICHDVSGIEEQNDKQDLFTKETDEFPSFDLGF